MPEIDFAFLADAAETSPGQKFHVLGGGITRIGGRSFPLRHPHLALVVALTVTSPETEREHELRIVLLDPDGREVTGATGSLVARGHGDGRDAVLTFSIDLWNLTFPSPGDYSFRLRDDALPDLRRTALRARAAYGPKDSIRDALPAELTEPFLESIDRLIRELNRRDVAG